METHARTHWGKNNANDIQTNKSILISATVPGSLCGEATRTHIYFEHIFFFFAVVLGQLQMRYINTHGNKCGNIYICGIERAIDCPYISTHIVLISVSGLLGLARNVNFLLPNLFGRGQGRESKETTTIGPRSKKGGGTFDTQQSRFS